MYAIFLASGKQFRAEPDAVLRLPSLDAAPGDKVTFDEVLLAQQGDEVRVGQPSLTGASVSAEILQHGRGKKIVVYKMKRRKGYRRKQGHRQGFTDIRVLNIVLEGGKAPASKSAAKAPAKASGKDKPIVKKSAAAEKSTTSATSGKKSAPAVTSVEATATARELAEEHDLDLSQIEGSGKDGRILKSDVERAIKAREQG